MSAQVFQVVADTAVGESLRTRLAAFLKANGIDPDSVPVWSAVVVGDGTIYYDEAIRTGDGHLVPDGHGELKTRRTSSRLIVPFDEVAS